MWGEGEEREGHGQRMDESRELSKIRFPSSHPEFSRNLQNSESLTSPFHFQYNPQTLLISFLTFLFSFLVSFLAPPMLVAELGGWDRMCVCVRARALLGGAPSALNSRWTPVSCGGFTLHIWKREGLRMLINQHLHVSSQPSQEVSSNPGTGGLCWFLYEAPGHPGS